MGQFSPRIVRAILTDRRNQSAMGPDQLGIGSGPDVRAQV